MFLKLIKDISNKINIVYFININYDIIQGNNHQNVKLFWQNFLNLALKVDRYVGQIKSIISYSK